MKGTTKENVISGIEKSRENFHIGCIYKRAFNGILEMDAVFFKVLGSLIHPFSMKGLTFSVK